MPPFFMFINSISKITYGKYTILEKNFMSIKPHTRLPVYYPVTDFETLKNMTMQSKLFVKPLMIACTLLLAVLFSQPASAQRRDRVEDRHDRREDVRDHRENVRDRKEDRHDRREDVRDRREDVRDAKHDGGRRDKREDVRDKREDVRDRKEDVRDRKENKRDRREDRRDRRH